MLHCKCQEDYFCQQNWSRRLQLGHVILPLLLAPPPPPPPPQSCSLLPQSCSLFSLLTWLAPPVISSSSWHDYKPCAPSFLLRVPTALLLATNTGKSPHVPRWWNPLDLEQAVGSVYGLCRPGQLLFSRATNIPSSTRGDIH